MKSGPTEPTVHLKPFVMMVQIVLNVMQTEPVELHEMTSESRTEKKTETAAAEATEIENENDLQSAYEVPRAEIMILVETGVMIDVTIADVTTGGTIAERKIGEMTTGPETRPSGIAGTLVVTRAESANVLRTAAPTVPGIREILEITEITETAGMTAGVHEAIATPEIGTAGKTSTAGINEVTPVVCWVFYL